MTELIMSRRTSQKTKIFQVIFCDSVTNLPSSSIDGTIALITASDNIDKVYIQSHEPQESNVIWIPTFDNDENNIYIKKLSSKVNLNIPLMNGYMRDENGGWIPIDTYLYQNKEWKMIWSGKVYYEGKEYEAYTGGWTTFDRTSREGATAQPKHPIVVRNENSIEAITLNTSEASGGGMFCTAEKIDLTPYGTLVFEGIFSSPYGESYATNVVAGVWSEIPPNYYLNNRLAYYELNAKTATKITVDVTNINTSAYIGFGIAYSQVTLTRCYLIPKEEK